MLNRQKALLELIHRAGGTVEKMRLVKWAFLLRTEVLAPETSFYGFVPYKRGPFSFTAYHELDKLTKEGWITSDEATFHLSRPARDLPHVPVDLSGALDVLWKQYGAMGQTRLVDLVYAKYPWFTVNSDWVHRRARSRPQAEIAVYTAGYEGLGFDDFLDRLLRSGIQRLIDVRANPVARRYGFHRSTLARTCASLKIEYHHVPELGIPSELRTDLVTQADRDQLFDEYTSTVLSRQNAAIARVGAWMQAKPSVLVCMEADPRECHRTHLGRRLASDLNLPLTDLGTAYAS